MKERADNTAALNRINAQLETMLNPAIQDITSRLQKLVAHRIDLEAVRNDHDQVANLRLIKDEIEKVAEDSKGPSRKWEPLPSFELRELCNEIEALLQEWSWTGPGRVEFDQTDYDIVVDGQSRQSHGKGVRAILYSAFVIGLLRYCHRNKRPHPGVVVIDSPLTSYKKGKMRSASDGPIDIGIEAAFWRSLTTMTAGLQIIIIENKEPPADVAAAVHYEWFAGENALPGERMGFIPPPSAMR